MRFLKQNLIMSVKGKLIEYSGFIADHPKLHTCLFQLDAAACDGKKMQAHILPILQRLSDNLKGCKDLDAATSLRSRHLIEILDSTSKAGQISDCSLRLQKLRFLIQREICALTVLKDESDITRSCHAIDLTYIYDTLSLIFGIEIDEASLLKTLALVIPTCQINEGMLSIPVGHFPSKGSLDLACLTYAKNLPVHAVLDVLCVYQEVNQGILIDEYPFHLSSSRTFLTTKALKDVAQYLATKSSLKEATALVANSASACSGLESVIAEVFDESQMALRAIPVDELATPHLFELYNHAKDVIQFGEDAGVAGTCLADLDFLKAADLETDFFSTKLPAFYDSIGGDQAVSRAFDFLNLILKVQACVDSKIKGSKPSFIPSKDQASFLRVQEIMVESRGLQDIYPISLEKPLCENIEEASLLPLHHTRKLHLAFLEEKKAVLARQLQVQRELEEAFPDLFQISTAKASGKPHLLPKREKEASVKAGAEPDRSLALESSMPSREEKAVMCAMGGGAGGLSNKEPTAVLGALERASSRGAKVAVGMPHAALAAPARISLNPLESLLTTQRLLPETLKFHPRVSSWLSSKEEGLAYYKFDAATSSISEEEMILRHRLPKDLLIPLFNKHYSQAAIWHDGKRALKKRQASLLIDDRAFTLQATLNGAGELYHFYAQPEILSKADEEKLSEKAILAILNDVEAEESMEMSIAGIKALALDAGTNNIICEFEGRRYIIKFRA
jgi:hypothetical protein